MPDPALDPALATRDRWRHDIAASAVVFLVALPLSLGIAIASGAPVAAGIIAAIIGGIVVGALGGVPLQVSGPAAGLITIVAELVATFGWRTTCLITAAAGGVQILLGLARVARAAVAISPAVVHGMLAGVGITIVAGQLHVVLDNSPPGSVIDSIRQLPAELDPTTLPVTAALGVAAIALTVFWPRLPRPLSAVPAPLIAVVAVTVAALPLDVTRVALPGDLFDAIGLPALPDPGDRDWLALGVAVITVALIASVESLLSAVAVERMVAKRDHGVQRGNLDRELIGQGAANALSGLAGGLPVTGVIVRSSTNVRAGARTRASAILHGLWIALFAVALTPLARQIPLAALAGLLVVVGIRLVSIAQLRTLARHRELPVYVATVVGVVLTNLLEGVLIGLAVALLVALYRSVHAPVEVIAPAEDSNEPWRVVIEGTLMFAALPGLSRKLARIPPDAPVRLELLVDYLDHAAYEMVEDWVREREARGGVVAVDEVDTAVLSNIRAGDVPTGRCVRQRAPRWLAPWSDWQSAEDAAPGRDRLLTGVQEFHLRTVPLMRDVFRDLGEGQSPSTLFIACSDSRVVPNLITSSGPGDLFTVRNLGAIVPSPETPADSTLAAVEYAVGTLGVDSIVVCGHTGCGAMGALLDRARPPALAGWLAHGKLSLLRNRLADYGGTDPVERLGRANIAQQLANLRRLPTVRNAELAGRLQLIGMMFDVAGARALVLDEANRTYATPPIGAGTSLGH